MAGDGGYDYLSIDTVNRRLFVSHGNKVDIIDLDSEKPIGSIDGMEGVHGIAIAYDVNKGFISDGKANAVGVFDLKTFKKIATISVSGKDPDAITYDAYSKRIFTFNGDSHNASVIDANSLQQIGTVELDGSPEFAIPDGQGRIYNNIEDKNQICVIDTKDLKILDRFSISPCGKPTGLYLDRLNSRLFSVCRTNQGMSVIDYSSKKVVTTLPIGSGVDAVVFDPATKFVFCSNGDGTTTIIRQESPDQYNVVQTLNTQYRAKTMAIDLRTHKIYLSAPEFEKGTKNRIPGSFRVLVYKLQS
ncbi:MAG TPA: YncE family protein [Puia sp.]|nr:YncE family protein [Puia sp.]